MIGDLYIKFIQGIQSVVGWFINIPTQKKVEAILVIILLVVGFLYFKSESKSHDLMQEKFEQLERKVEDCNLIFEENKQLKDDLSQMKINNIMLKATSDYLPFPFWIKDRSGIMIYLNSAYEKTYLHPRDLKAEDYIGKTDYEVWGQEIGDRFRANDSIVLAINRPITFKELDGQKFTKFTVKLGDYIVGVAGVEYVDYN